MRRAVSVSGLVLAAVMALANSGCLAVAVGTAAAGGAVGYAYVRGNVSQDYRAGFNETWTATHTALLDLGLPVLAANNGQGEGSLESRTGDNDAIRVSVDTRPVTVPADGPLTRVSVRVGMVLGDRALSERLLAQVETRLASPPQAVPGPPQGTPVQAAVFPQTAAPPLTAPVTPAAATFPQTPPPPLAAPAQSWSAPTAR